MRTRVLKVYEFAEIYSGGTPSTNNPNYWHGDIAWITPKDMSTNEGVFIERGERSITAEGLRHSSAYLLPANTVIISSRAPVGYVAVAKSPLATNQGCKSLKCKEGVADPLFIYYLLKTNTALLETHATGSTYKELSLSRLKNISFKLPVDIEIQSRIASILLAYDSLIENNRRRIQLLEQAARLLYKEWFVHFRFPGHEHVKMKDGLPDGWGKIKLHEVAEITMGQSPPSKYYNEDGIGLPFHQGVTNFGFRFPMHQTYCTLEKRIAEHGDILFSVRAPVGRINLNLDKIVIGRGLAAIRSNRNQQNFLFYQLKEHFFKEDMMGGGAIFAAITKKDLYNVQLVQPSFSLVEMFEELVHPIDRQIETLHRACGNLTSARDILLPRLMNGEIAV